VNVYIEQRPTSWALTKNPIAEASGTPDVVEKLGTRRNRIFRRRRKKVARAGKLRPHFEAPPNI
jgi:hypothetical protein